MSLRFVPLRARVVLGVALVFQLAAGAPAIALAEIVRDQLWVTDGEVRAVASTGTTVFIGGAFTKVGPAIGGFATFNQADGSSVAPFAGVTGTVNAILPDGAGGYYLGGSFTGIKGQPRNGLAHVDASGAASSWNPDVSGTVHALAIQGSTVYVGGSFTQVGGQPRSNLAAVDATTGAVAGWSPNPNGIVKSLLSSAPRLFVGGLFHSVAGQPRHLVASFDVASGALESWAPNGPASSGSVEVMASFGGRIFLAGFFTSMGGQTRSNLASVDATSGIVTTWNPNVSGSVFAMTITQVVAIPSPIPTVWIGGSFSQVGGVARLRIAGVDGNTGALRTYDPGANGTVRALRVILTQLGGIGTVFAGGDFTTIAGAPRAYIASLNGSGTSNAWSPLPTGPVNALVLGSGTVVAGGAFYSANMTARANIAEFDASGGGVTSFTLGANGAVNALLLHKNSLYVGGAFNVIGTSARGGAAEIDIHNYFVSSWDPDLRCTFCGTPTVYAIARGNNANRVFLGGSFEGAWTEARRNIVLTNGTTGAPLAFDVNANFTVRSLALRLNPGIPNDVVTVYAGGDFNRVNAGLHNAGSGGTIRYGMVALDPVTGEATSWDPDATSTASVRALNFTSEDVSDPGIVWASGQFAMMGGQARSNVAAIGGATGLATTWNPNANGMVRAMLHGPTGITLGGDFTTIGGQPRNRIACVDGNAGAPTSWNPDVSGNVLGIAGYGGTIFAGGGFSQVSKYANAFFAGIGDGIVTAVETEQVTPAATRTVSAAPNPSGGHTSFRFALPRREAASVAVYDVAGRLVRTLHRGVLESGTHTLGWSGKDNTERAVGSGIYFVRVDAPSVRMSAKVLRLR